MAKMSSSNTSSYKSKSRVKRRGIHAKTKSSNNKHSKNYLKMYRGQGK